MLTVGIVANEASGDLLGAALIRELRALAPDSRFVGVAGPQMLAAGCETLVEMERLSVMGLTEVLGHLRELLKIRRDLGRHFRAFRPDVFIGVDAPDFNLGLESAPARGRYPCGPLRLADRLGLATGTGQGHPPVGGPSAVHLPV